MDQNSNKRFDLEDRTLRFSKEVLKLVKILSKNYISQRLGDQVLRSATSIGANYIEANDALGKKDLIMRLKISRKEAKETIYWLSLILENNPEHKNIIYYLMQESQELKNILSKIIINCK